MNHIRFLSNNAAVCDKPRLLGHDFVVVDYAEGKSCDTCLSLILAHNERERQYDLLVDLPQKNHGVAYCEDMGNPPKGIMMGIALSSILWALIALVVWLVFF